MDELIPCPKCLTQIKPTDYFCYFCGRNLRPKPPSTSIGALLWLLLKTILFPPLGLWWGSQYLRQSDLTSKLIGGAVIAMTVLEFIWVFQSAKEMMEIIYSQLEGMEAINLLTN